MKPKRKTAKLPKPVRAWAVWNEDAGEFDLSYVSISEDIAAVWASGVERNRQCSATAIEVRIVPVAKKRRRSKP